MWRATQGHIPRGVLHLCGLIIRAAAVIGGGETKADQPQVAQLLRAESGPPDSTATAHHDGKSGANGGAGESPRWCKTESRHQRALSERSKIDPQTCPHPNP